MKEPIRLKDVGSDEVRALLQQASPPRSMNAKEFARGQQRVARLAALPLGFGLVFWLKGIAYGAGVGAALVAGAVAVDRARDSAPTEVQESTPLLVPQPKPLAVPSSSALPEPAPEISAPPEPTTVIVTPQQDKTRADALAEEAALIEKARSALKTDPAEALARTREYRRHFPRGQLGLESEIVAIEALVQLGRREEACARARRMLGTASGIYGDRIRNLCPESL